MHLIGHTVKQPEGFAAFIPAPFPPESLEPFPPDLLAKAAQAERLIGKLDGITHILPDADFFLSMYTLKDATQSTQIEGTRATMLDALEMHAGINVQDTDADGILHYIDALHYGRERLRSFPFTLRFIRELHRELMTNARSSHFANPGEFRQTQNWIGGSNLQNARFVPPPVHEMLNALSDLEKFLHAEYYGPVIQVGLIHAQFETIHPFLDGNGRTGRLLITLFLLERQILEKPVLFLSAYFKKHQQLYYQHLQEYHEGNVWEWLHFFLDGIIETATEGIELSKKITALSAQDMQKIQALGKREATSGVAFLRYLYKQPIVNVSAVMTETGFSRVGAMKLIERFVDLNILVPMDESVKYGKSYFYKPYFELFNTK